jgi:hypothetical protein
VTFPNGIFEQTVLIPRHASTRNKNLWRQFTVELYALGEGTVIGTHAQCTVTANDKDDPGSHTVDYLIPDRGTLARIVDVAIDADDVLYGLAV